MANMTGTNGDDVIIGTNDGENLKGGGGDDLIRAGRGDDVVAGGNGDDVIYGGGGDDIVNGGRGNDLLFGGTGADDFQFRAGAIDNGGKDFIADFSLSQGDTLSFLSGMTVISAEKEKLTDTEFNSVDLRNNVEKGTDITFLIRNDETQDVQEVVLLDVWSGGNNAQWMEILAGFGLDGFGPLVEVEPELPEEAHMGGDVTIIDLSPGAEVESDAFITA